MKCAIFAVVLIFQALSPVSPVPGKAVQKQHSDDERNKNTRAPNKPPPAPVPVINPVDSHNPQNNCQTIAATSEQKKVTVTVTPVDVCKDWWDRFYIVASLVIAGATIILALTARTQASAAKLSAKVLMDGQRAFVQVEVVRDLPQIRPDPLKLQIIYVPFIIRNYGQTPARITKVRGKLEIVDRFEDLPPEPSYDGSQVVIEGEILLVPTVTIPISYLGFGALDYDAIRTEVRRCLIYGFVDYRDVHEREHQTRFCYAYRAQAGFAVNVSGFYIAGPPVPSSYNKAT